MSKSSMMKLISSFQEMKISDDTGTDPQDKVQNIEITIKGKESVNGKLIAFKACSVRIPYRKSFTLQNMFESIVKILNKQFDPKQYVVYKVMKESFIGKTTFQHWKHKWNALCSKSITHYSVDDITNKGLVAGIKTTYHHVVRQCNHLCEHLKSLNNPSLDPLQCPIYKSMQIDHDFTEDNLSHLYKFGHFNHEYTDKTPCTHGQDCMSFTRLESGEYRLDDRCHVKLFRHPPRSDRQMKLNENTNINAFVVETNPLDLEPTFAFPRNTRANQKLIDLITEIISNGFKSDLCLNCGDGDDCKHDIYRSDNSAFADCSILRIVNAKMDDIRHVQMGKPLHKHHMLALILYTGCQCNYDLCKSQRNGDYKKWKIFDYSLSNAIELLSKHEKGSCKLYSGLRSAKMDKKEISQGFFPTYVSCSWVKDVSEAFMRDHTGKGMIIEFDKDVRETFRCCDVSWISKFPDEYEILMSRTASFSRTQHGFTLSVLDDENGKQRVSLRVLKGVYEQGNIPIPKSWLKYYEEIAKSEKENYNTMTDKERQARQAWKKGDKVEIFSCTDQNWNLGEVTNKDIYDEDVNKTEWLTCVWTRPAPNEAQERNKRLPRFSNHLRPVKLILN
eukprot:494659_1